MTRVGRDGFFMYVGHEYLHSITQQLLFLGAGLKIVLLDMFLFFYSKKQPVSVLV